MVLLERASEIGELFLFFPKLSISFALIPLFSRSAGMADAQTSVWKRGNLLSMARIQ